jgi:hypothetical protein
MEAPKKMAANGRTSLAKNLIAGMVPEAAVEGKLQ